MPHTLQLSAVAVPQARGHSFREHEYSSYSGGMGSEGIDAALYAFSTRVAWGRVGHPKEENLQLHDESTCLCFISIFKQAAQKLENY